MKRIIFVHSTGYLPGQIGGANISLHALFMRLAGLGYEPIVICAPDEPIAPRLTGAALVEPQYAVLRRADPIEALREAARRLAPSAVVVRAPDPADRVARIAEAIGQTVHIYFQSGFFSRAFPSPAEMPLLRYGANSPFLARMAEAYFGAPVPMIPPVIEPDRYRCEPVGDAVLFVNPIAWKGVHIAAAIARALPHRRFIFVRSWSDNPVIPHVGVDLPNVELAESTHDTRRLFERTKLLLVPSVCEESSARVIGEAQVSGIPTVTSDRGGLVESVGGGGVCLPLSAPIERWSTAVEAMFAEPARYAAFSRGAKAHAERPDYLPERAVERFLEFIGA